MRILDWIRGGHRTVPQEDERASEDLERIIQLTNPRLRFARRYRARLLPAVQLAKQYARSLIAGIPPARDASNEAWRSDDCMRAFFASADELMRSFSRSPELRAWFDINPHADRAYAVLSMALVERHVLGTEIENGIMRRDVPQTTLSFADHRVRICGRSEAELRQDIERRVIDQLALTGLALASQDLSQREVLEEENALLRSRRRLLESQGAGLASLSGAAAQEGALARLRRELAVNEENLRSLAAGPEALDYQLEKLLEVLSHAGERLFVSSRRVRLNRMNVVVSEESPLQGEALDLQIARIPIPDGPPEYRTFALTRFARESLLPSRVLYADAARMLH
ncbi:MAG TPA: hypothetical protein VJ834_06620 [Burkholderiales bacterium]|nr:hypothetical protein [Burkholderiales bacterium]